MSTQKTDNSYRSILKGISVFGGVKVFEIAINLIRGKFVALFLGPDGMGINSIFTSSANTVSQFSSLGLNLAIVREVAEEKDEDRFHEILGVVLRLTAVTAAFGALFCVLFSTWLSRISFGSTDYWWQFMLLGVAVYFLVSNGGKLAVLQGMHEVKRLSRASIVGSATGLLVGVPLYWLFGTHGIIPAIISLSLSLNIFYTWNLRKSAGERRSFYFSWSEHGGLVKKLVSLGMILVVGSLLGSLCNYLLIIFVRESGGLDPVGLFQASSSVTNQMSGVVFAAMAMDYFPRLTAAASNDVEMMSIVRRQSQIVVNVITPLVLLLILFAPIVIRVLFTDSFLCAVPLMRWMAAGICLKAMAYPMGYIPFARNDKRLFFWLECVFSNFLFLICGVVGYHVAGLPGLGYGMVAEQAFCIIVYMVISRTVYGYSFDSALFVSYAVSIVLVAFCIILSETHPSSWILMAMVTLGSVLLSVRSLKRLLKKA